MKKNNLKKIAKNFIFFSILCIFFLNLSCSQAVEAPRAGEKSDFIEPLLLSDYDSGSLYTNIGGETGGDENKPGLTFAIPVPDESLTKGGRGYSLMLDYDVSGIGEYSFYWVKLGKKLPRHGASEVLDLSKYNYLSFWIRGLRGKENVKIEIHEDVDDNNIFVFDKDISSYVYLSKYLTSGRVTTEWQKVLIPLKDFTNIKNWTNALELVLVFENRYENNKSAVYIDDVLFGWRSENILDSENPKPLNPPLEASFRVNNLRAKQCLVFTRSNELAIDAESYRENPFIESVGFEYSTNDGFTWTTIGTDYDVSSGMYKVMWYPKDSAHLHNYKVRAVATDIFGNQAATGVLIDCGVKPLSDEEFLNLIQRKAFEFFYDNQNLNTGLFADTSGGGDASIASTGFGLTALCVGAERGWIDKKEAEKRVITCLNSFLPGPNGEKSLVRGRYGFFYHFVDMEKGSRAGRSEISTVDTALLICGAITAGEYFGGTVKAKAEALYKNVEWGAFLSKEKGPFYGMFSMGWSPERGFLESYWDYYTDEAILICLLAIGSPTHPVDPGCFYAWTRRKASYGGGKPFICSWHGALFSYQYAHAWFDFRNIVDKEGVNWFENSKNATIGNRQFCIDHAEEFKTFGPNTWGVTSMARPEGYTMHFGVPPTGNGEPLYDGTISPTGPAGSIVFTPYLSLSALKFMYFTYPKLWGKYGLKDSYNLDINWYAPIYYGLGEALYVIPIENFRTGFVWEQFMKNKHVQEALIKAGFTRVKE